MYSGLKATLPLELLWFWIVIAKSNLDFESSTWELWREPLHRQFGSRLSSTTWPLPRSQSLPPLWILAGFLFADAYIYIKELSIFDWGLKVLTMVGLELMTRKSAYMLKGKIAGLSIILVMNRYCILSPRASPYLNPQRNSYLVSRMPWTRSLRNVHSKWHWMHRIGLRGREEELTRMLVAPNVACAVELFQWGSDVLYVLFSKRICSPVRRLEIDAERNELSILMKE